MMVVRPGEGRVPYEPMERREPAYTGRIVVPREEGIVEKLALRHLHQDAVRGDDR